MGSAIVVEGFGSGDVDIHPHRLMTSIWCGHPRMADVTDNRDLKSGKPPNSLLDRHQVEQALGRMISGSVASGDNRNIDVFQFQEVVVGRVADNDCVHADHFKRLQGVIKALAF